ncbi:MAG: S41 family peptidase [Aquificaceae bacterium]
MGAPLLLILLLFHLSIGAEDCPKEETLSKIKNLVEREYLWWDRLKDLSWEDEKEFIEQLRKIGDRWTSITKQDEDRLWYSSSKMVGLGVRWDDKGYVKRVFPNSPAELYGIREGDLIVSINGVSDRSQWRIAIREAQDYVDIELIRDGFFINLMVKKGEFVVPVVEDARVIGREGKKVGYVKLSNFTQPAVEEFRRVLEGFKAEGVDVLLLDLRDNGGGLISVAKNIADMLIGGDGVMFYLEGRGKNLGVYTFRKKEGFDKPILIFVNKQTASAAELFAVLLRNYAEALIVGENTVGKYVGSNLYPLDSCGNVLRLVTFEMRLPSGETITDSRGISPDCKLESEDLLNRSMECLSNRNFGEFPSAQP